MPEAARPKADKLTRADALQYLQRFPEQGRLAVAINLGFVVAGNALLFWLLWSGRLRAAHLVVLVLAEAALLFALGWLQQRLVPARDWPEPPKPARERAGTAAFLLVWIAGAYGMTLLMVDGYGDLRELFVSTRAWREAGLHWAFAYTIGLALFHFAGDLVYYKAHGGKFLSNLSHDTLARLLTLILGGIPFAMPFFVAVFGGLKGVEFVAKKARVAPEKSALAGVAMIAVAFGSFALVGRLIDSGVAGWAIGFVFAKLLAELMVACVPLVMRHVARHGP